MAREPKYFSLSLESLRSLGSWAADCAERALPVYEQDTHADSRPRDAIEGIRGFAAGGKRTARLRSLALAAFSAARDAGNPAAAAAARSAGDQEVVWAIEHAPPAVRAVLGQMPAREMGKSRLENLMYRVDAGIRGRGLRGGGKRSIM